MTEKTIAIVEDDHLLALVMSKFLTNSGYKTLSFSKGEDLLTSISSGLNIDLAILDVKLKGELNGIDLCQRLHENTPVIFCTGNSDHSFLKENNNDNIKGVLIKPIDLKELINLLSNVV